LSPAEGSFRNILNAFALNISTTGTTVSLDNSVIVGTLYPEGQTEVPSILSQLDDLKAPVASAFSAQSLVKISSVVIKSDPALFMSVA